MDTTTSAFSDLQISAARLLESFYDRLPAILAAVAVLILGWLLAGLARRGARRFADLLNRFLDRSLRWGSLASARVPSSAITVIGELLYWAVVLLSLAVAARVAGVGMVSVWFDKAATHFPHLVIGSVVIVLGWAIAARVGGSGDGGPSLARRFAQGLIVAVTLIVGLGQIGLDMQLPVVLLGIAVGATFFAFSVAFGLGAREYVAANIASRALTGQLQRGMRIQIDQYEGDLIEIGATHLLLDTDDGHVLMPLSSAMSTTIVIRRCAAEEQSDDE